MGFCAVREREERSAWRFSREVSAWCFGARGESMEWPARLPSIRQVYAETQSRRWNARAVRLRLIRELEGRSSHPAAGGACGTPCACSSATSDSRRARSRMRPSRSSDSASRQWRAGDGILSLWNSNSSVAVLKTVAGRSNAPTPTVGNPLLTPTATALPASRGCHRPFPSTNRTCGVGPPRARSSSRSET